MQIINKRAGFQATHDRRKAISAILPNSREVLPLPITGLILCGGKSKRMGCSKAFLPYESKTFVEHLYALGKEMFTEICLVTNEPDQYAHVSDNVVKDILPHRGPLGGILSGLLVAHNPYVFVIACDMPLVTRRLLRQMADKRHDSDVLVLEHQDGIEPLLGIYSKKCIEPLEESLFSGNDNVKDFLSGIRASIFRYENDEMLANNLPPYFNVNTPRDYSLVLLKK